MLEFNLIMALPYSWDHNLNIHKEDTPISEADPEGRPWVWSNNQTCQQDIALSNKSIAY